MSGLEEKIRNKIVNAIKMLVYLCLALSILLFIFYMSGKNTEIFPVSYILKKIVIPFIINYVIWRITDYVNNKEKYNEEIKKYVCCIMLCTVGGVVCISQSNYTPLWVTPMLATMFCCIFCDTILLKRLVIYSYILSVLALVEIIFELPGERKIYLQHIVLVLGIDLLIAVISFIMVNYITEMLEKISSSSKQLETDALTCLHSRPYIYEKAQAIVYNAKKEHPISIAILDLDHFKHVNDTYGHENGDVVLRSFGRLILKNTTPDIMAGRFGGEEFLLIFDGMTSEEAYAHLDKMRIEFSQISYEFSNENVTFSSGLVTITSPLPFKQLFTLADNALYRSKENGRNQITVNTFH